jgi:SARP family transcriptional regulator, regulator of embCAB operon
MGLGEITRQPARIRVQLCGHFVVRIDGERIEGRMPGRQGRLLFAFLAARPHRTATRDELIEALWRGDLPSAPDMALSALVSKLRRLLGQRSLEGRSEIRLDLARHAFVDVQAARQAVHDAEALSTARRWWDAYPGAVIAGAIARREFLRGEDAPWISEVRQEMADVCVRAIECNVRICLAVGGPELPTAARLARELTVRAPYRESGYCLLMRALERHGDVAEAIRVYDSLRTLLGQELGAAPSPQARALHERLLRGEPAADVETSDAAP